MPRTPHPAPTDPFLYTPEEAAKILKVLASWLRRRAAARLIPCTFLGKHLRFSAGGSASWSDGGRAVVGPAHAASRRQCSSRARTAAEEDAVAAACECIERSPSGRLAEGPCQGAASRRSASTQRPSYRNRADTTVVQAACDAC